MPLAVAQAPGPEEITPEEWEALCHGCGQCCYEKWEEDDGTIVYTDTPCRFLDVGTKRCLLYEHRFEACHDCLALDLATLPERYWLPEDCGYVQYYRRVYGPDAWRPKAPVIFLGD